MKKGLIREDFYYRIRVMPIELPPLKDRKEDVPLLIEHFLDMFGRKDKKTPTIPGKMTDLLKNYPWPGNIRELQSVIRRYLAVGNLDFLHAEAESDQDVPEADQESLPEPVGLQEKLDRFEKDVILEALNQNVWHRGKAATALKIGQRTLYTKMKKLGLT